jgi:hypothetical protein
MRNLPYLKGQTLQFKCVKGALLKNNAQRNIHEIKQTQMQTSNIMNKKSLT